MPELKNKMVIEQKLLDILLSVPGTHSYAQSEYYEPMIKIKKNHNKWIIDINIKVYSHINILTVLQQVQTTIAYAFAKNTNAIKPLVYVTVIDLYDENY